MKNKQNDYGTGIPKHEIESFARLILPDIQAFFATEEGRREYAEWEASQAKTDKTMTSTEKLKANLK